MTKAKLLKKLPLLLVAAGIVTGLAAPAVNAHTKTASDVEIDFTFAIKEEVYVNGEALEDSNVQIADGKLYLPLELVTYKMGDRLEGSEETGYYLRKNDKMLVITPSQKTYSVNMESHDLDCKVIDNTVYVTLDFIKNVLNYDVNTDGNVNYIGTNEISSEPVLDGTALDNIFIKQDIFVNGVQFPSFGVAVKNNVTMLPLETICEKMGDRLEGSEETTYYLRKADKFLVINHNENKYVLNGEEKELNSCRIGGKVYVSLDFFNNVLGYEMREDGNSVYIGQDAPAKAELPNTIPGGTWSKENDTWYYLNAGTKVKGWVRDNNTWYYMNEEGKMQTGWVKVKEKWYYLNKDGAMQNGWINDGNGYYYLNEDGDMAYDTIVDGFNLAENGMCFMLY